MENILEVKNLSIQINKCPLIQDASFEIKRGEAVLLSGTNGIGKSTLLKSILGLDKEDKQIAGEIIYPGVGNILKLDKNELQLFRARVAYVQQKDEFSEMGNIQVRDIISESGAAYSGKTMVAGEVNDLIDKWIPRRSDNTRIFDAKSKPAKFSGGEQRLLSVLSVVATRPNADLVIIDEPLNNLDIVNARVISNVLNKIVRENQKMGLLMISHCRIFPFITKELRLTSEGITEEVNGYVCHSCFGEPNIDGFYC